MVIQHNMIANFTQRELKLSMGAKSKSTEKLASGYRINRAADDAAGLSISEKMRWQIRGLNKGADNISTGVSLIKTAEGALGEVHDILQRIRELSLQAYNDTNTQQDRDAIQDEIDASLEEINRIRDTTMFNTKYLLKGDPEKVITVEEDQMIDGTTTIYREKKIPDWLSVDPVMKKNEYGLTQLRTDAEIMKVWDGKDTSIPVFSGKSDAYVYEPNIGLFNWSGREWTETMNDNPAAKVDFSALAASSSAEDLHNKVFDLIGTSISFPCGTCGDEVNTICYGGDEDGLKLVGFYDWDYIKKNHTETLNLSQTPFEYQGKTYKGYFDAINALWDQYGTNYDEDADNNKDGEAEATSNLAKAIAKDLRDKSVDLLDEHMLKHFDRATKMDNDDYSFVVYDFRDKDVTYDAKVETNSRGKYEINVSYLKPGTQAVIEDPMKIMCGAENTNWIPLKLPNISLDGLGLQGYEVNHYIETESYSEAYQKKLAQYEASAQYVTETGVRTVNDFKIIPATYTFGYNEHGEWGRMVSTPGSSTTTTREETYSYQKKVYTMPKPEPGEGDVTTTSVYNPSSLWLVDDAIAQVSQYRTMLGAQQNRLEHAYDINRNVSENTQYAESRIRDTDMADEMVSFSKHSIVEQVGQSMLAQANNSTQGVLSLLG